MEATTNRNLNREIVAERLQNQREARKEAIKKQEEAHARFERVMIRTVNEHHAGITQMWDSANEATGEAADEAGKQEAVQEFKRKRELGRAIDDGGDYMLQIYASSGAFVATSILRSFGIMPLAAGILVRILLAGYFAYNVYRVYQVSGVIAELSEGGR